MTQPASKRLVTEAALTDPASPAGAALNSTFGRRPDVGRAARSASGTLHRAARRQAVVPIPARPNATLTNAAFTYPRWISADGGTLYGQTGPALKKSTDDGATWSPALRTFANDITAIREMTNGELLVVTHAGTGVAAGEIWRSTGGQSAWTKVLTTSASTTYIHPMWGLSVDGGARILASEYGTKIVNGAASSPRYVWLSEDYGATWRIVYDLGNQNDGHIHGCAYDKYWDRLWVVTGDSTNRRVIYSDDFGATWGTVSSGLGTDQMVGIHPMRDCVLFTTDSTPNGIRRVWRTDRDEVPVIETAYLVEDSPSLTVIGSLSYQSGDGPALFPFHRSTAGPAYLVATYDGVDFFEVWKSGTTYNSPGLGLQNMFGPTASGKYVGTTAENSGSGLLLSMGSQRWAARATKFGSAPLKTWASCAPGFGAAKVDSSVGAGLTDLDLRFTGSHPSWAPVAEEALVSRYLGSDGNREWWWSLRTDGKMQVRWYPDKTNASVKSATATTAATTAVAGKVAYLRVTVDTDNGAAGSDVKFYESLDKGATWTQIGMTVTLAGTAPLPSAAPNRPLIVGGNSAGEANPYTGDVHHAAVYGTIGGALPVALIDFNDAQWALGDTPATAPTSTNPTYTDPAGNMWTLISGARIVGLQQSNTGTYAAKPKITGSRSTATAAVLASLLTALDAQGLVTDATTA